MTLVRWFLISTPIDNAYVAGLSDELGFYGNELVHLQTMYTVGAVVGQLPFAWLFTKVRMHWLLPGMDLAWGVFTLLQYRANGYSEMMAYRFLVGLFEVSVITTFRPISKLTPHPRVHTFQQSISYWAPGIEEESLVAEEESSTSASHSGL